MAKGIYIGDSSNKARKAKKLYIGDASNKARKVKKVYIWDANGKARLAWQSGLDTIVVVGGNSSSTSYLGIAYSVGKGTFQLANYNTSAYRATDVCYGEDKFVVVCSNIGTGSLLGPHYSYDGITWTQNAGASLGGYETKNIVYLNGYYIANTTNLGRISYSKDGITWYSATVTSSTTYYPQCITYCNGQYWIGGSHGCTWTSPTLDGTWTVRYAGTSSSANGLTANTNYHVSNIASNGTDQLVCYQKSVGLHYYDFTTNKWILAVPSNLTYDYPIEYGGGMFRAIPNGYAYYSYDSKIWTRTTGYAQDIYYDGEYFLCRSNADSLAYYVKGDEAYSDSKKLILPHSKFVAIAGA